MLRNFSLVALFIIVLNQPTFSKASQNFESTHSSLKAYPGAVISTKDLASQTIVYVETDGRHVTAIGADGRVIWVSEVVSQEKPIRLVGSPVIRHVSIKGRDVIVVYGKHSVAKLDLKTGKIDRQGSD